MKIMVTGASGFLGSSICHSLSKSGHDVIGLDIVIPMIKAPYRQIQCDLLTIELSELFRAYNPDQIIHCAGNANVGLSVQDPFMDLNGSYVLLHRLLYSLKSIPLKPTLLFVSSAAVYGNPVQLPISETAARAPVSPYGLHKAACEDLCEYFSRVERFDCKIVRIFSAFGVGLRKQLLWDTCQKIRAGGLIKMFGTGNETRDFIHVDDVVRAIRMVLDHGSAETYNIANGKETSIAYIVKSLLDAATIPHENLTFSNDTKTGDPLNWCSDIKKLQNLGYSPSVTVDRGVQDYWNWFSSLPDFQ